MLKKRLKSKQTPARKVTRTTQPVSLLQNKYALPTGGGALAWVLTGSVGLGVAIFGTLFASSWLLRKKKK